MIFVTIGTNETPFDRLLRAVDALPAGEEVVAQCGSSALRPARAACVDFLPFDELVDHVRRARVVVTHAGAGTVLVALANGKRPIVVPRLERHGEAVDDHQVAFARRLDELGLVKLVEDEGALPETVRDAAEPRAVPHDRSAPDLAEDLRAYLHGVLR
jgi:UDP-N-acetylglucosamine transferase subunit ALG13